MENYCCMIQTAVRTESQKDRHTDSETDQVVMKSYQDSKKAAKNNAAFFFVYFSFYDLINLFFFSITQSDKKQKLCGLSFKETRVGGPKIELDKHG